MCTGFATENAELMLQRYGVELPCIQRFSGTCVVLELFVVDLHSNDCWVLVGSATVIHRDDDGLRTQE